jgi:hypothetical protein
MTVPSLADELVDEEELEVTEAALRTWSGITPRFIGFSMPAWAVIADAVLLPGRYVGETPDVCWFNDILAMTLVMDGPVISLARGGGPGTRKAGVGVGVSFAYESLLVDEEAGL